MIKEITLKIVFAIPSLYKIYIKLKERRGSIIKIENINLDVANKVILANSLNEDIHVGLVRDLLSDCEGYIHPRAGYPKFERFLRNNNIRYEYFDIQKHDWIDQAINFNVVIWQTPSSPAAKTEALEKIYVLEEMGIKCMPTFKDLFRYENKVGNHYFYKNNNLPEIPTFVSFSRNDAIAFANNTQYPIISKITTGSSSCGVDIIKTKLEAIKLINIVFSQNGEKTYWKYVNQKDYVYFQKFIDDAQYDLRIIVVGDSLFGYYRYPNKGDFRASGAGNYEKKALPLAALDIAWDTKSKYGSECLATDFVYSQKEDKYYIIESSIFIGIDTAEQLVINGVAGRYKRIGKGNYNFEEGRYWIQELILLSFFKNSI